MNDFSAVGRARSHSLGMAKNVVVRGLLGTGGAALALAAWLSSGCQVQTDLADASGGTSGNGGTGGEAGSPPEPNGGTSGKGGGTSAGTGGVAGTGGGHECVEVTGYFLNRSDDAQDEWAGCIVTFGEEAPLGCAYPESGTCPDAFVCAVRPDNAPFAVRGCIPEGWTSCGDDRPLVECSSEECFDGTLQDFCGLFDCPASLEDAVAYFEEGTCSFNEITIESGCGISTVRFDGGLGGSRYLYDDETGELVAATVYSDVAFGPCYRSTYYAGPEFEQCPKHTQCTACGPEQENPDGLACRLDCDCNALEPIADPCFGPETCDCYCATLKATEG
jgi:hypothetical protein